MTKGVDLIFVFCGGGEGRAGGEKGGGGGGVCFFLSFRHIWTHYKYFNNEVSEAGYIQSGTTMPEGGPKAIVSS